MAETAKSKPLTRLERGLIDLVDRPVFVFSKDLILRFHNGAASHLSREWLGYTLGHADAGLISRLPGELQKRIGQLFRGRGGVEEDDHISTERGLASCSTVIDRNCDVDAVIVTFPHLLAPANGSARFDVALDNLQTGVIFTSAEPPFGITRVNEAFCRMTGYEREELIGRNPKFLQDDLEQGGQLEILREALEKRERCSVRLRNRRRDGTAFTLRLDVCPVFDQHGEFSEFVGLQTEESFDVDFDELLEQERRLEALGRLSAGLAHDFNNDLTVILQSVEFVLEDLEEGHPSRLDLEEIRTAARHASRLASRMSVLGRVESPQVEVHDLKNIVAETSPLMRAMIGAAGRFRVEMPGDPAPIPVRLDRLGFERVVLNLISNAADAIDLGGEVVLTVTATETTTLLSVSDDGRGMRRELKERIFQPYFSTKGEGGTGLGLASCLQIVESHGGTISVESELGKGTTFTIELPLDTESLDD